MPAPSRAACPSAGRRGARFGRRGGGAAPAIAPGAPTISGAVTIGGTLTITPNAQPGSPVGTYVLYRDGVSAGAVVSGYTYLAADIGPSLTVKATNAGGTSAASNALSWVPGDAGDLRGWYRADVGDYAESGGIVSQANDLSGNGNHMTVPAGVAGATGPAIEADAYQGKGCFLFNGTTDALAKSTFGWGTSGGPCTLVAFVQRLSTDSGDSVIGYQNAAPWLRTTGTAEMTFTGASTTASSGSESAMGPTCAGGTFSDDDDRQSLYIDGAVDTGPTANANAASAGTGTWGFGYNGHPTTAQRHFPGRIRQVFIYRAELTAGSMADLAAYHDYDATPLSGPVEVITAGQSNAMGEDALIDVKFPRRDLWCAYDHTKASGPTREQVAWGPQICDFTAVVKRGFGMELMRTLREDLRVDAHRLGAAYTGAGFMTGASADRWIPPSSNGGTGGEAYDRLVDLVTTVRAAEPTGTARTRTWLVWAHGETDALAAASAAAYETNLANFISDLESDLSEPDLRVLLIRLHTGYTGAHTAAVRTAMTNVAAALGSRCTLLDVDGYALEADATHYTDAMHLSVAADIAAVIEAAL